MVPAKVHLPLEALGTDVTAEGLEACMLAAVRDQVGALAEGFATHLALVRFFSCGSTHTCCMLVAVILLSLFYHCLASWNYGVCKFSFS